MTRFVPYLSEQAIEHDAATLLAEYARSRGVTIKPPIPIDDIVEKHLKLGLHFDDTHRLFGLPRDSEWDADILGAIFFDQRRIIIDESLDPVERPGCEERFRFTLCHEVGHWRLHRDLYAYSPDHIALSNRGAAPSVLCRSSQKKERVEWQADLYASCLLMPRDLVINAWQEHFGDTRARVFKRFYPTKMPGDTDGADAGFRSLHAQREDYRLNEFVRPFAEKFLVSMAAMRICLERLGLLRLQVQPQGTSASKE